MYNEKDFLRIHINKYFENHGPRYAATYLQFFLSHFIMNANGFFEVAHVLNIMPIGFLPLDILAVYSCGMWGVYHDYGCPDRLHFFESIQRIGSIILHEIKVKDNVPVEDFELEGWLNKDGDDYLFAMELCLPSIRFEHFLRTDHLAPEIKAKYLGVDVQTFYERTKIKNLSHHEIQKCANDYMEYSCKSITIKDDHGGRWFS